MTDKIKDLFLITCVAIKEMPFFLKVITVFCLFGSLLTIGLILPIGRYEIYGEEVTLSQFWADGAGFVGFITGILMLISAIGFIKRFKWARILFLSIFPTLFLIMAIMQMESKESLIGGLLSYLILFLPIVGGYLFGKKTVKDYFK